MFSDLFDNLTIFCFHSERTESDTNTEKHMNEIIIIIVHSQNENVTDSPSAVWEGTEIVDRRSL